jgi:hypothetical protein
MISSGHRPPSRTVPHRTLPSYSTTIHPSSCLTHTRSPSNWRRGVGRLDSNATCGGLDLDDGAELECKRCRWGFWVQESK